MSKSAIQKVTVTVLLLSFLVVLPAPAHPENLKDVLGSRPMRKVELATEKARKRNGVDRNNEEKSWFNGMDPQSNYALIWGSNGGPSLLLSWVGANIPQFQLKDAQGKRYREFVRTKAAIVDRERIPVFIEILIPHPTYRSMVKYHTLAEFNNFEPPWLQTVAEEELVVKEQKAMYYRSRRGRCSMLFKIAQFGILNLSVNRCENSRNMSKIAQFLDYARLNKKLDS